MPPPLPTRSSGGLPTAYAVNGAGNSNETKPEPPPEEYNVPALPPKKSVSRMSTEVAVSPVPQVGTGFKVLCLYSSVGDLRGFMLLEGLKDLFQ